MTPKKLLLAVDDDPRILRTLQLVLSHEWEVVAATSTGDALALMALGTSPDAVLVELELADDDAISFVEQLPDALRDRVVFSSLVGSARSQHALSHTRALVLRKPIQLDTLEQALQDTVLGVRRATRLVA